MALLLLTIEYSGSLFLDPSLKFSSITFGAPPVTRPRLETYVLGPQLAKRRGLVLSMMNEYDLVPRTDGGYIRSLVDLYRSIYNLPPIQEDTSSQHHEAPLELPRFDFKKHAVVEKSKEMLWPLPEPVYSHIGKIVIFKTELVEGEGMDDEDHLVLNTVAVMPEHFAKLLWCNVAVHKRVRYAERVGLLGEGKFNGRERW